MNPLIACKTAEIKRSSVANGKVGDPVSVLTGLSCTEVFPADPNRITQMHIQPRANSIYTIFEVFIAGSHQVLHGDTIVIDEIDYLVHGTSLWPQTSVEPFMHLTIEREF